MERLATGTGLGQRLRRTALTIVLAQASPILFARLTERKTDARLRQQLAPTRRLGSKVKVEAFGHDAIVASDAKTARGFRARLLHGPTSRPNWPWPRLATAHFDDRS